MEEQLYGVLGSTGNAREKQMSSPAACKHAPAAGLQIQLRQCVWKSCAKRICQHARLIGGGNALQTVERDDRVVGG